MIEIKRRASGAPFFVEEMNMPYLVVGVVGLVSFVAGTSLSGAIKQAAVIGAITYVAVKL